MTKTCTLCGKPHYARGWCKGHYYRWSRHGNPQAGKAPGGFAAPGAHQQWIEQVLQAATDECIEWPFASRNRQGYGTTRADGKTWLAHRRVLTLATHPGRPEQNSLHAWPDLPAGRRGALSRSHRPVLAPHARRRCCDPVV